MNTAETLHRLHSLLPLKERQQRLSRGEGICHQAILLSFVEQGRALAGSELSSMLGQSDVKDLLSHLSENDLVVLDKQGEVTGAYPFTMKETAHKLKVNGHTVHAMCALDALAVSSMFGLDVSIDSRCAISGEPIYLRQRGLELLQTAPSDEILMGIHWQKVTSCAADSLCREMIFLKDLDTATSWQSMGHNARELFSLHEAMELAAEFFVPLISEKE
jgi:mercuric reductase